MHKIIVVEMKIVQMEKKKKNLKIGKSVIFERVFGDIILALLLCP
jgi:hypothetical protein